jgi:hypothetical protein
MHATYITDTLVYIQLFASSTRKRKLVAQSETELQEQEGESGAERETEREPQRDVKWKLAAQAQKKTHRPDRAHSATEREAESERESEREREAGREREREAAERDVKHLRRGSTLETKYASEGGGRGGGHAPTAYWLCESANLGAKPGERVVGPLERRAEARSGEFSSHSDAGAGESGE